MGEVSPELVQRMIVHLRKCALEDIRRPNDLHRELMEIVELLPEPVDPDLVEARGMAEKRGWVSTGSVSGLHRGFYDESDVVQTLVFAIKRGRELAEQGK